MLFKIKTVRRGLRKLAVPTGFLILLNSKTLSDSCGRGARMHNIHTFEAGISLKTNETEGGRIRITQEVYGNK